jgi:4-hydroxybenzoate polyprenyltransferase
VLAIFRLIRFQNLLIIAATQYIMRYCIIWPFLKINNFVLQLNEFHFFLLVISTVFVAAAGYVINDYFDTGTDRLNRPDKVVIDRSIQRRQAMLIHFILNFLGIGTGIYLSYYVGVPELSIVFITATGLLWFYSTDYKRQFLIGNIVVSIMTGIVPLMVILYEMPLLNAKYGLLMIRNQVNFNYIFFWIAAFSFFAFLTTLLREIIKDAEDFEGDSAFGMNTLPIIIGRRSTKIVIVGVILTSLLLLIIVFIKFLLYRGLTIDYFTTVYFLLFLILPFLILLYKIIKAQNKEDFHFASQITKVIMLAGILYSLLVSYIVTHQLI